MLHEDKPDVIVLRIGSNDITSKDTTINIGVIIDKIIGIGKTCKDYGMKEVTVFFVK